VTSGQDPILFGQPWFDETEEQLVLQTIRSGWIGQGPLVELFEQRFSEYLGAPEVVTVSSCTAGLQLALVALGIGPGAEVITTPFTFVATMNAIDHVGATPVLVDIERGSLNISPQSVERAITERTRAIMPVHFGGRPLDTEGFYRLAERHDLWIIEDAAHATGSVAHGRLVGGSKHPRALSAFSFYPNKNLSSAEGGAVSLADVEVADHLRRLRLHGLDVDAWKRYKDDRYQPSLAVEPGFKFNWTDLQAALALGQLEKLEGFLATREYLAERYDTLLAEVAGVRPVARGESGLRTRHALHLYQVEIEAPPPARDRVVASLRSRGIGAAVHYLGVNHHPYYANRFPDGFPVSDRATASLVTLPLHMHMADAHVRRVVDELEAALRLVAS
jgi:dTDP-4-amino-4,6-dideoxygalactose transaminase